MFDYFQALETSLKEQNVNYYFIYITIFKIDIFWETCITDKHILITSLSLDKMLQRDEKDTEV